MKNEWIILMIRDTVMGDKMVFPMMQADPEGDPEEIMATFPTKNKAIDLCNGHILAKSSECLLVNIATGETETL